MFRFRTVDVHPEYFTGDIGEIDIFRAVLQQDAPFFSLKLVYKGDVLTEAVLDGVHLSGTEVPPKTNEPILVSACLLGVCCRYDGQCKHYPQVEALKDRYTLIPVCPEQLGGLPTPRTPAEISGDRVVTAEGIDVTAQYDRGAEETLKLAQMFGCKKAILKARSPSCGCGQVYDGTFTKTLRPGSGRTAERLEKHGILIFHEDLTDI